MIFHCPFCGLKAAPEAQECASCKRGMVRPCPYCAESVAANAALCKYCGEVIGATPPPEKPAAREADIRRLPDGTPDIVFLDAPAKKTRSPFGVALGMAWKCFFVSALFGLGMALLGAAVDRDPVAAGLSGGVLTLVLSLPVLLVVGPFRLRRRHGYSLGRAFGTSLLAAVFTAIVTVGVVAFGCCLGA